MCSRRPTTGGPGLWLRGRGPGGCGARGLVVTVVQDYYAVLAAERKHVNAKTADNDAAKFLSLTEKLEHGGEVAHSDVLKAQLQANDRKRGVDDSEAEAMKARLELAVLILPDVSQR